MVSSTLAATAMRSLNAARPQPAVCPKPMPQPEIAVCPEPMPDIDFTTIDTPQKAALLPTLNPTALAAVAAGLMASMSSGAPTPVAVNFAFGQTTTGSVAYSLTNENDVPGLEANGTLGAAAFSEKWTVDQENKSLHITGTIGNSTEDLTLTADERNQVGYIDGKIGDVEVHQTISMVNGKTSNESFIRADGTLGGVAFRQEIHPSLEDQFYPHININGTLGTESIASQIGLSADEEKKTMFLNASGNIGAVGYRQDSEVQGSLR